MEKLKYKSFEDLFSMIEDNSKDPKLAKEINEELRDRLNYLWGK